MAEVDGLITPERQRHLVEVHPEASFTALGGGPMRHSKKTTAGRAERLGVLRRAFADVEVHAGTRLKETGPDDILDAFVVTWSVGRWLTGTHVQLGGELDRRGLRMEIVA